MHAHQEQPLLYRITAAWGNHEGSMLLWLCNLQLFNLLHTYYSKSPWRYKLMVSTINHILIALFVLFVLYSSNPFLRIFPAPIIGKGLNPILQDIGLAMHPPMLYCGYVGLYIAYSTALAAMLTNLNFRTWANDLQPWLLLAWSCLTAGITLGSWWAYRELGWGGYWYWDPVENASLIPWIMATALLHSLLMVERVPHASLLLAIFSFGCSLIGTFIVRSGLITSVHSFAVDPERGIFILVIIALIMLSGLLIFAVRSVNYSTFNEALQKKHQWFFDVGLTLMAITACVVLLATLLPLLYELYYGQQISISANFYNTILLPIVSATLFCTTMVTHHYLSWRLVGIAILLHLPFLSWQLVPMAASATLLITSCWPRISKKFHSTIAHTAIAILMLAICYNAEYKQELIMHIKSSKDVVQLQDINLRLENLVTNKTDNYQTTIASFALSKGGKYLGTLQSEQRYYANEEQITSEAGIYHSLWYDIYLVISMQKNEMVLRVYYRPLMAFIWLAGGLLTIAGLLRFVDCMPLRRKPEI